MDTQSEILDSEEACTLRALLVFVCYDSDRIDSIFDASYETQEEKAERKQRLARIATKFDNVVTSTSGLRITLE